MGLPGRNLLDDAELAPLPHETMTESAAGALRALILSGRLPPGTPLRLSQLAARLGMSVMPVREALRALEAERLVTFRRHRGAVVATISSDDVEEAYAVREALEGLAARDGVRGLTDEVRERIRDTFAEMEEAAAAGDRDALVALDQAFHRTLYDAGGRPERTRRIVDLWESTRRAVPLTYREWDPLEVAIAAHRPILDAVERGDARAAERLSRQHTRQAAARLLRSIHAWTAGERERRIDPTSSATVAVGRTTSKESHE